MKLVSIWIRFGMTKKDIRTTTRNASTDRTIERRLVPELP